MVLFLFTLSGYLSAQSIALTFDGDITEGAENTEVITITLSGTGLTFANPLNDPGNNIIVTNLPGGVTYTISRENDTELSLTLTANREKDYDSDITDLTVSVADAEVDGYSGSALEASTGVTFTAVNDTESLNVSFDGSITEGSENGEVITVTITGGTFANPLTTDSWTLNNLPEGVTKGTVTLTDPTTVEITLSGNRTHDYDSDITNIGLTILEAEVDDTTGADFAFTNIATFTATDDTESLSMADDGTISEGSEDGEVITVTLTGGTFADPINSSNWTFTNLPRLVSKGNVTRKSATTVEIELSGNRGDDYDTDITNLTLNVTTDEVNDTTGSDFVISSGVTFDANNDDESLSMDDDGEILEGSEDGEIITVTLTGGTFVETLTPDDWTLTNLPSNVTKGTVTRTGSTSATITLSGNRDVDYSSDITDLTLTVASSEINDTSGGSGLIVNTGVTFTHLDEPTATLTGGTPSICTGESYDLEITVSGVNGPFDVTYQKPDLTEETLYDKTGTFTIPVSEPGKYILTAVEDAIGVTGSVFGTVVLSVNPLPTPSITGNTTTCKGVIEVYHVVGTSGSTYLWEIEDDGTAIGALTNDSLVVQWAWDRNNGHINVTETTDQGCSGQSSSLEITLQDIPKTPTIFTTPADQVEFCEGTTLTLKSDKPDNTVVGWLWSDNKSGQNNTVSESGDYIVRVYNSNNCYSKPSTTYTVTENPLPLAVIDVQGENSICVNETGTFKVSVSDGTGDITVEYTGPTPGSQTTTTSFLITDSRSTAGTITYQITDVVDSKGCIGEVFGSGSASITVNSLPNVAFNPPNTEFLSSDADVVLTGGTPTVGGTGTYSGDAVWNETFHPSDASTTTPNDVTYTFTDLNGCTASVTVQFNVIEAQGDFTAEHAYDNGSGKLIYCTYTEVDTLYGIVINGKPGGYFVGPGIINFAPDSAYFNPASAGAGDWEIEYVYYVWLDEALGLWSQSSIKKTARVDYVGNMIISGLDPTYCANDDSVRIDLVGSINNEGISGFEGVEEVTGLGVTNPFPDIYYFDPKKGITGQRTVSYTYTRTFSQCVIHDEKIITVNPLPEIDFKILDSCIYTTVGTDSIQFENTSPDAASIVTWEWDFGDGKKSSEDSPWHDYNSVGTKLIVLKATNNLGCTEQVQQIQEFQEISRALFGWENECLGDTMHFMFKFGEVQGNVISWEWDFDDGTQSSDTTVSDPRHKYDLSDNYEVTLNVENDFGCRDTVTQVVPVRPTFLINAENPYSEDFETGTGGWLTDADPGSFNSWEFGKPSGTIIGDTLKGNAWATSLAGLYVANEKSYVESPCFDFSEIEKPMIRMDVWAHTENTRDGAALQTSIDDGKTWTVLGSNLDGINWYNSALLTGEPGGQRLGWTGTSQSAWKEARNMVDHLKGKKFRLRVAFGSDAVASNYEGFAFDNVWVGERTRMVVLEHFTNSTSAQSLEADPYVNDITGQNPEEVIDIQYHTSFPGSDPRNTYFPSGPSSRTLYYGVAFVPYSVMDGIYTYQGFDGETGEYNWKEANLLRNILIDPLTTIDLSSSYLVDNTVYVEAEVGLIDSTLKEKNLTLHLAIVENETAVYESVLKKMLPDAGGTSLIGLWDGNNSVIVYQSWSFTPSDFVSVDSLVLVAFVQNEDTKDVYQAAYVGFKDLLGTGIFDIPGRAGELNYLVYPNPASAEIYLKFDQVLQESIQVQVFNELGALIEINQLQKGNDLFSLDVANYKQGVYLIHVTDSESNSRGWKRFVVVH